VRGRRAQYDWYGPGEPRAASVVRQRRSRCRPGARVNEEELSRRNLRFGWALFGLFVLLFVGTLLVALLYLQID